MVPEIYEAVADPSVRVAFKEKITYERLGKELDKMFEGNKPERSITDLHNFNILSLLYKIPETHALSSEPETIEKLINKSDNMCQVLGHIFTNLKAQLDEDPTKIVFCDR